MAKRTWSGSVSGDWSATGNWVEGSVPVNSDDVYIPAGSAAITTGLNQSAVTLGRLEIEDGYSANIGTKAGYLRIAAATVYLAPSGGSQFIDLGSSNISVEVRKTGSASTGTRAVNLKGSNLATVTVLSGSVGIATDPAATSTVATVRAMGGSVWIGQGVTLTTVQAVGANVLVDCAATTLTLWSGTLETRYTGAVTTVNVYDGTFYPASTGTITTLNGYGGTIDFRRSALARTVTTLNATANETLRIYLDSTYVTVTTFNRPSGLYEASFALGA